MQSTHYQLEAQLQQIQTIMQATNLQYATAPYQTHQDYGGRGYYGGQKNYRGRGGRGAQRRGNWRCGHGGQGSSDIKNYCWKQGMCVHQGTNCRTPTEVHKNNTVW